MKKLDNRVWEPGEYDECWRTYNSPGRQFEYEAAVLKHVPRDKSLRIVDIGCGIGRMMHQLWARGYRNLEGFDYSTVAIERLHALYPHLTASVADVTEMDFSGYGLAIVTEVIEHLDDDLCLRLPERYIASVPNGEGIAKSHVRAYFPEDIEARFGACILEAGTWLVFGRL